MAYANNPSIGDLNAAGGAMMGFGNYLQGLFTDTFSGTYRQFLDATRVNPEDYAATAGGAAQKQWQISEEQMNRSLSRMGVDPNSGRFAGMKQDLARARAAAVSGIMNSTRLQAGEMKFNRLLSAAGMGLNIAGMAGQNLQGAASAFGSAGSLRNSLNALNFEADRDWSEGQGFFSAWNEPQFTQQAFSPSGAQQKKQPAQGNYGGSVHAFSPTSVRVM